MLSEPEAPKLDEASMWSVHRALSPLIGSAIHNGTLVRPDLAAVMALSDADRLREEDPFTEHFIADVPNRIIVHRSRFEVDLNRARAAAIYRKPEDSWGLSVWRQPLSDEQMDTSLDFHDRYYALLANILSDLEGDFGHFVLLDVHSYNHRRKGADAAPSPQSEAPTINIGTISMDRARWSDVLDPFMQSLRSFEFEGRGIDVEENVAFEGRGEQTRFVHENFPDTGCAIAIEFKKVFMDEWTGEGFEAKINSLRRALSNSLPVLLDCLKARG